MREKQAMTITSHQMQLPAVILCMLAGIFALSCRGAEDAKQTDAKMLILGKKLYAAHCQACHGRKGKGDGEAAISLLRRPSDLSDTSMADDDDEDVLEVITRGRHEMPAFAKMLDDTQRRRVLDYVRTLAPKSGK